MILTYRVLTTLIYPFLLIFIYFRKITKKEDSQRYKEKILSSHFNINRRKDSKLIWFHAASIGEFKSILPVIKELNLKSDNLEFLITTVTLSSSNLAKTELKKFTNAQHRFLPFDVIFLINDFLRLWKPNRIILVDSEIWPNLILQINKRKIPLALFNARITSKTYKKWMTFPNTARKIFSCFNLCISSNLETKEYLYQLGVKNNYFNGNAKLFSEIHENVIKNSNKAILMKNKFWIAASTHEGEDVFFLKAHNEVKKIYKNLITIIAPRHIDRVQHIKSLCRSLNLNAQILNKNETILEGKEIIIINSFGVLQSYFKYAKSVFIGKSTLKRLEKVSGQNPIEAAKLGCKIYHGPYVYNFKEIYEILKKNNISKKIETCTDLSNNLIKDFKSSHDSDGKTSILINNLGEKILADTMKNISNFVFNETL